MRGSQAQFDPMVLHAAFEKMIKDLEAKNSQVEKKIEILEENCKDEEKRHWQRVAELKKKNEVEKICALKQRQQFKSILYHWLVTSESESQLYSFSHNPLMSKLISDIL